jgi:hypothetical protein
LRAEAINEDQVVRSCQIDMMQIWQYETQYTKEWKNSTNTAREGWQAKPDMINQE